MSLLIRKAVIVDAEGPPRGPCDILLDRGRIARIGEDLPAEGRRVIDAAGRAVFPGFIDMHAHFRVPGQEYKETVETGSRAAVRGGFTTVLCMPNTDPVIDDAMIVRGLREEARRVGLIDLVPIGAITRGQRGEGLTDMVELKRAGCPALSDDGLPVADSRIMRLALEYARMAGVLLIQHCQDPRLSGAGVMNEGVQATLLGLPGDPEISETVIIARDIELARYLEARVHFAHVSTRRSVALIRRAKEDGIPVSAEACPHHFTLTEEAVAGFDSVFKVNPPLRTADDVAALKEGLADGTIDVIATDHAPHTAEEKERGFEAAPCGMIGLETAAGLTVTELVRPGILSPRRMAECLAAGPARLLGLERKGRVAEGFDADLTLMDMEAEWEVRTEDFRSRSRNSPFVGRRLTGRVLCTIGRGKVVFRDPSFSG